MLSAAAMTKRIPASLLAMSLGFVACKKEAPPAPPPATPTPPKPGQPPAKPQIPPPADVAAPPATATKFPNGVAMEVLTPGTGTEKPRDFDIASVNYTVWTTDGKMFDTSTTRHQPQTFPLSRIPPGWSFAIQQMTVGEKAQFWVPEELAFKGRPGPQGTNVVQFELVNITKGTPPEPPPPDVKEPPKDAKKLPDGLAIKVLKAGTGKEHPTAASTVQVNYTGWTTDGKMFDSSHGKPVTFPLGHLIPGWIEGIPLMVEGESARMWIPEELAYKGRPGAPKGMLVFDIELVKILPPAPAGGAPMTLNPHTSFHPSAPTGGSGQK